METGWWWRRNSFGGGDASSGTGTGGDDIWDDISTNLNSPPPPTPSAGGTRCYDWTYPATAAASTRVPEASVIHALLYGDARVGSGSNSVMPPDPHMICLKLGKRHYCDDAVAPADRQLITAEMESSSSVTKRGKQPSYPYGDLTDITAAAAATTTTTTVWPASSHSSPGVKVTSVPRCQVEGCHVVLSNTKEYYRRHKVCEIHSKSPKVVVLGLQQRFCQQCSRFHRVMEFDEAKRSCRRRLEGHNQRRRKGSFSNSLPPNFPHSHENNCMMERRLRPSPPQSKPGYALSLLSSPKSEPWISSDDLSSKCSAALYELIAANRATCVAGHRLNQDSFHQSDVKNAMHGTLPETQMWDGFSDTDHTTMTLDLKQAPALSFGLLSVKEKANSKNPEEWTDYCWSAFGGSNVV